MHRYAALLLAMLGSAQAADLPPELPPTAQVAEVLRQSPEVLAAASRREAEAAQQQRLEAGPHEWTIRMGSQQRRSAPAALSSERYQEWNATLERPWRLPGKAVVDARLGASGVALAETAYQDALHEGSRELLRTWFAWLRETAVARQWTAEVDALSRQASATGRRQRLGDASQLDTLLAEAALARAEAQRQQATARQKAAEEDLRLRFPGLTLREPAQAGEPETPAGDEATWISDLLTHSHELRLARGEAEQLALQAERLRADRLPDPSVGLSYSRERSGEEQVVGAFVSIPLPGTARRATADAGLAQAEAARRRAQGIERRVASAAAALYHGARAGVASWQAADDAARRLEQGASLIARAQALGEGSLNEVLNARRLANEARLAAVVARLDALELGARLRLDAHRLWDFD